MQYENPEVPEGINYSRDHPLKEYAPLAAGAVLVALGIVAALVLGAGRLAQMVPFEVEAALVEHAGLLPAAAAGDPVSVYLQGLADRLAAAQSLPRGLRVTVQYLDGDVVNGFATLGGQVFVYRGLLARLPHENALAMLLAHEVAHVAHRDPIVALGRGVAVGVALASLAGLSDSRLIEGLIGQAGTLTTLGFSRRQEARADAAALAALERVYGHVRGAEALFEVLAGGPEPPVFFSTHPLTGSRMEAVRRYAAGRPLGPLTPLPDFLPRAADIADAGAAVAK